MPRLKKTLVEERETFVRLLFQERPTLSVPKANALVREHYGRAMNLKRMYELRTATRTGK